MDMYNMVYWKIPKNFLKLMGIWPYDDGFKVKCKRIFTYVALFSLMIPLGIRWIQDFGKDKKVILENTIGEMYLLAGVTKLTLSIINRKLFLKIYKVTAKVWKTIVDKEEMEIIENHAKHGLKGCIIYTIFTSSAAACFIVIPMFDPVLNLIKPLENGTRPMVLPYYAEYFIDQEKYYIPLISKAAVAGSLSYIINITYDMAFSMFVQNVCGQFDIICHRLNTAAKLGCKAEERKKFLSDAKENVGYFCLKAIQQHQKIIRQVELLEKVYNGTWFLDFTMTLVVVAGSLTCVLMNIGTVEMVRHGGFFSGILAHKFYIFLHGQKIIDYNEKTFNSCYSCKWYNFDQKTKILVKIMLMRCLKPLQLTGGKVFTLCMESFANMLKTGLSYLTVYNASHHQ